MTPGASRIPGIGASLRRLRVLRRAVQRVIEFRAQTPTARRTAAQLYDDLTVAFTRAVDDPDARASLAAVDDRRQRSRKTPPTAEARTSFLEGPLA